MEKRSVLCVVAMRECLVPSSCVAEDDEEEYEEL
jgi:hypothetical protein